MRSRKIILLLWFGLAATFVLNGCTGSSDTKPDHPVTTTIPQDDVSDLSEPQAASHMNESERVHLCSTTCPISNLVERDDMLDISFDQLTQDVRVYSFRGGLGKCAINLTGGNGGVVRADTYNRWDPNEYAEPKNLHFTIGKSNQAGDYCVPNGSVWEKTVCTTHAPDQILRLHRVDIPVTEEIWISTYKGWKGTLMAKKSGILHPMVCQ